MGRFSGSGADDHQLMALGEEVYGTEAEDS